MQLKATFPRLVEFRHSWPAFFLLILLLFALPVQADDKMKIGFILTGPISDLGWDYSQDQARKALEKNLPWVQTSYVESVPDSDVQTYIDQMAEQGDKIIFTTSATFTEGTIDAATRYPDILFFDASGYKQSANVGSYVADLYQCSYLMGMASAGLSKNGKIGCISSFPSPEGVRGMDGFVLGVHAINPKAILEVRWLNEWYDPPAAKEAAETLIREGYDVLVNGMDSPTVEEVAESHGIPVSGQGITGSDVAPNTLIAGTRYDWGPILTDLVQKVRAGTLTSHNLQTFNAWWRLNTGAVTLYYKPGIFINPKYKAALMAKQVDDGTGHQVAAYDLILQRYQQMLATPPQFEPFTGPLTDADGKLRVPAGKTASQAELFSITWRLPGILGNWPMH